MFFRKSLYSKLYFIKKLYFFLFEKGEDTLDMKDESISPAYSTNDSTQSNKSFHLYSDNRDDHLTTMLLNFPSTV